MKPVLVTGVAGFIGYHVARRLLDRGEHVIGVDCFTPFYDVALKEARLARLQGRPGFSFSRIDLSSRVETEAFLAKAQMDRVIHLAAQVGVRYSLVDPHSFVTSNVNGFLHVLEACRARGVRHLVYASSSSVYGGTRALPFREKYGNSSPLNLYAATKSACEMMAHSYGHLWGLRATGLRFFTVYGPWGRPDMAVYSFTRAIERGEVVRLHGAGEMRRDFTHVDDIVSGVLLALDGSASLSSESEPHTVYNLGGEETHQLTELVTLIENAVGQKAVVELVNAGNGEMQDTFADCSRARLDFGYAPVVRLSDGIPAFVNWYREYHAT